jgi:hypothetical protein
MPPAIIGGAIAAVGTIGGAVLSSHAASSAASQANASQQAATQSQLQLGREALGLNQNIYNANYQTLSPFVGRGNVAGESINALLGLPSAPAQASPLASAPQAAQGTNSLYSGPSMQQIQAMQHDGIPGNYRAALNAYNSQPQMAAAPAQVAPAAPATPAAPAMTPQTAMSAYNNFANSAGIQSQMQALNQNYAAHGLLQSGAAMKGVQQSALQNYFLPYMGLLSGQQSVGAQGAAAIAGVGSNFGNTAAGIANGMSNAIGNGADAASNSALLRGQNSANMWGTIGSSLGGLASSFFPSGVH